MSRARVLILALGCGVVLACSSFAAVGGQLGAGAPWRGIIKVAVVAPFSGSLPTNGLSLLAGARLAADEINRGGGVAGYRVELLVADERNPETPLDVARDPGVIAVIGHLLPPAAVAASIYGQAGLEWLAVVPLSAGGDSAITSSGKAYPLVANESAVDRELVQVLTSEHGVPTEVALADVRACLSPTGLAINATPVPTVVLVCGGDPEQIVAAIEAAPPGATVVCASGCDTPDLAPWSSVVHLEYASPVPWPVATAKDWSALVDALPSDVRVTPYTAIGYDGLRLVAAAAARAAEAGRLDRETTAQSMAVSDFRGVLGRYGPRGIQSTIAGIRGGYPGRAVVLTPTP